VSCENTQYNLLYDTLIGVRSGDNVSSVNLPELLSLLGQSEDDIDFPSLRLFQLHSWYAFLVQVSAIALSNATVSKTSLDAETWRSHLLMLTNGSIEPWCLVAKDLALPAFMQPPVPEKTLEQEKWNEVPTPGALDLLVTGKNHDVKSQLMRLASPEHWLYAIVSLQTTQGYSGRDNHGIARMNAGLGSRPCVTIAHAEAMPFRFRRDLKILLEERDNVLNHYVQYKANGGVSMLWTVPWDGTKSLDIECCDPYFIEICRRVRLTADGDSIKAFTAPSKCPRISAKELCGVTGDPWTPVDRAGSKALTVSSNGFNYRLVQRLLFSSDYEHGITWRKKNERGNMVFIACALARGQGRTEGFHKRVLRIPRKATSLMAVENGEEKLSRISVQRVEMCSEVRRKVLHFALCAVTQGAPETPLKFQDQRTGKWLGRFEQAVDSVFFEKLFEDIDDDEYAARQRWIRQLISLAEIQLEDALQATPQPTLRRYRVESRAKAIFHGQIRKLYPDLFENQKSSESIPVAGGGNHD